MIETSTNFQSVIQETSRHFTARFLYGDTEIDGSIKALTIYKGACGEDFQIGSVFSSYLEATMVGPSIPLENKELLLKVGLELEDGTVEEIDMGYFTVTKPRKSATQVSFTAVGRIASKLNTAFIIPQNPTISGLVSEISRQSGVSISTKGITLSNKVIALSGHMTCRDVLVILAETIGAFATEDNAGNIVICKYQTTNPVSYDVSRMTSEPEFNYETYDVTGVKVVVSSDAEDDEATAYTAGNPIRVVSANQFMTQELFDDYSSNVLGYSFMPGLLTLALGDPRFEPWDNLLITDMVGDQFTVPCLNITHSFDGGFMSTIMAPGESESDEESEIKGAISKAVIEAQSTAEEAKTAADEASEAIVDIKKHVIINSEDGSVDIVDDNNTILARYSDVTLIGKEGAAHIEQSFNKMSMIDGQGKSFVELADLRGENGLATVMERFLGDGSTLAYTLAVRYKSLVSVTIDGDETSDYTTIASQAIQFNSAPDSNAVIEITYTTNQAVYYYTLGSRPELGTVNAGPYSFVAGQENGASGPRSVAMGKLAYAQGPDSEAHGIGTYAQGLNSEAHGTDTIAAGRSQFVFGTGNIPNKSYLEIVGNGPANYSGSATLDEDDPSRSNARTLDRYGNEWIAGALSVGDKAKTRENLNVASKSRTIINEFGTGKIVRNTSNTPSDSTVNLAAYEELGLVYFRMAVTARSSKTFTSNTAYVLCTIPSEYRPGGIRALNVYNTGTSAIQAEVNSSGEVTIRPKVANTAASATIYISGVWLI